MRHRLFPLLIGIILFAVPFFWFKPGEMDLGGDSSRLYFYQPVEYLKNQSLFAISKSGLGGENLSYYGIPHFLLLAVLKTVFPSPTVLISLFYGLNLALAFWFVYLTVKKLGESEGTRPGWAREIGALLAALSYVFPPTLNTGWSHVILTFYQVFLNPLIFYLLLQYFISRKVRYILSALLVTLIFSPNFSFVGAPPFFAFYPFAILFLIFYTKYIRKTVIPLKGLVLAAVAFLLLHAFQFLPILITMFSSSATATAVFSPQAKFDRGLGYFSAIAREIKVSLHLMGLPQLTKLPWYAFIYVVLPSILLLGFLWNRRKTLLLTGIFFLIALFWVSANITNIGLSFYKSLFAIPGFSMFRNYYGQWGYLYLFFYALILGQALTIVLGKIKKQATYLLVGFLILLFIIPAWPFINGTIVHSTHWQSKKVETVIRFDPEYEKVLSFFRLLTDGGKVLTLPLTDPGYQIIAGERGGAYEGPSTIAYLTGRQDFSGFNELGRFKELILDLTRKNQLATLKKVLGLLNIRYIFYNADSRIYDEFFPGQPYSYVRRFFPKDQVAYQEFIQKLSLKLLKNIDGRFFVYELDDKNYLPEIFVADKSAHFDKVVIDWRLPLSLSEDDAQRPAFFEHQGKPPVVDETYVLAQPDSIFLQAVKNPDPPLILHHTFVTTAPWSPLYPLIMLKEELMLVQGGSNYDYASDRRLFLSAKRVLELERWGKQIAILGNVGTIEDLKKLSGLRPWNLQTWFSMNSWEANLARYLRYYEENMAAAEKMHLSKQRQVRHEFLTNEYLLQHRMRLMRVIKQMQRSDEETTYLKGLVDTVFTYLFHKLNVSKLNPTAIAYQFDYPQEKGDYEVYIEAEPLTRTPSKPLLKTGDQNPQIIEIQPQTVWAKAGTVYFDGDKSKMPALTLIGEKPKDLIDSAQRVIFETTAKASDSGAVEFGTSLFYGLNGLLWKMTDWQPESYYLLSFDYQTHGNPFVVKVFEGEGDVGKSGAGAGVILENQLYTREWTNYQAVIRSNKFGSRAFLQILGDTLEIPVSNIEIKNLSLLELPHPKIVLKKVKKTERAESGTLPQISFVKVNPTKYKVKVTQATRPYVLVFNQSFNSHWQLFLPKVTASPKGHSWETWAVKRMNDTSHYEVNGYANAWYIAPQDVDGRTEYELILEMTTQRTFYVGLAISLMGLVVVVGLLLRSLIYENKA